MDDRTVKLVVKLNFLVMALVLTLLFMSNMKSHGLSDQFRALFGFDTEASQTIPTQPASR